MAHPFRTEISQTVRLAKKQGWDVQITGSNHLKFIPPARIGGRPIFGPLTPGSYRGVLNFFAKMKRAGLVFHE